MTVFRFEPELPYLTVNRFNLTSRILLSELNEQYWIILLLKFCWINCGRATEKFKVFSPGRCASASSTAVLHACCDKCAVNSAMDLILAAGSCRPSSVPQWRGDVDYTTRSVWKDWVCGSHLPHRLTYLRLNHRSTSSLSVPDDRRAACSLQASKPAELNSKYQCTQILYKMLFKKLTVNGSILLRQYLVHSVAPRMQLDSRSGTFKQSSEGRVSTFWRLGIQTWTDSIRISINRSAEQ